MKYNKELGLVLLILFVLCSCTREGQLGVLLNEKQGKSDLSIFIFKQMVNFGGTNITANIKTSGINEYVYSVDADGFQIVTEGNNLTELRDIFQAHFGNPAITRTNDSGDLRYFVYSSIQTGVAINCSLAEATIDNSERVLTHLTAVRASSM